MAADEHRRIVLFDRLVAALGEEAASTLVGLLPPPGTNVATKDDIAALRRDLRHVATKADLQREIRLAFVAQTAALAALLGAAGVIFG